MPEQPSAGAAVGIGNADFISSALFSVIYYSLVYICIYMDMKCSVYARTIDFFHVVKVLP